MLQEKAMLANLTIHQWTARKFDKSVTSEVEIKHNAKDAGAFSKRLIDKDALKALSNLAGRIRETHYQRTLPWGDNGDRLLPSVMYFEYTKAMRDLRSDFTQLTEKFIQEYPTLVQDAHTRLGSLYEPNDYPDVANIRSKFDISLSFLPVSDASDFRVDVGAAEVEVIKQNITLQLQKQQQIAIADLWKRLHEVVSKVKEKLSNPSSKLHDSLLENVRTTASFVRKLNLTNDAQINYVLDEIERQIRVIKITSLRNFPSVRCVVAEAANNILMKIPKW